MTSGDLPDPPLKGLVSRSILEMSCCPRLGQTRPDSHLTASPNVSPPHELKELGADVARTGLQGSPPSGMQIAT